MLDTAKRDGLSWHQVQVSSPYVVDEEGKLTHETVPSEVNVELIASGDIPDPYIGMNEWEIQGKCSRHQ
jgi:hypothetical protein